ncbi:hypothetical protein HW555_003700 [Spodoptera exigua]|uniref:Uncharacterized protein n=1 Tax=Spodoptera exigua TaxID=7107 RepID=A0A835GND4_SPOEX|nr:hypothetical protein HW555_003700 [Spodoptera exigua]
MKWANDQFRSPKMSIFIQVVDSFDHIISSQRPLVFLQIGEYGGVVRQVPSETQGAAEEENVTDGDQRHSLTAKY